MGLVLRDNLSFCVVDQHVLFLDVASDKYFGVNESTSAGFLRVTRGEPLENHYRELSALIERGYIVGEMPEAQPCIPDTPIARLGCIRTNSIPQRADIAKGLIALGHSALVVKSCSLLTIIDGIRRRKRKPMVAGNSERSHVLANALKSLNSVVSVHDRCFLYSLALTKLLLSAGISPTLIFGVKLAPFSAHCWVQDNEYVLSDEPDHVRLFTPILAV